MRDEHDDRIHQALRHDFAANIGVILRTIAYAFDRLHDHLYSAPWKAPATSGEQPRAAKLTTL